MASKSEVTIRCYQPEDSAQCRAIFSEGIRGLQMAVMKIVYPDFFKAAVIFLLPITAAIAVKWSVWTSLVLYFVAFVLMTAIIYIFIYVAFLSFINDCLKSDLLDIGKHYAGDSCMFVAECDGRVIGMVAVDIKEHHKPGVAELQRMSVCPSARGKGVGKLLVNRVVEYCKEKKFDKVILTTSNTQHAAVALYKKCGFKCVKSMSYPHLVLYSVRVLSFEKEI